MSIHALSNITTLESFKRILRYLNSSIDLGLQLQSSIGNTLVAFFFYDVRWAVDTLDYQSQHAL